MAGRYFRVILSVFVLIVTVSLADENEIQMKKLDQNTTIMFNSENSFNVNENSDYDPDVFVGEGNPDIDQQIKQENEKNTQEFFQQDYSIDIPNVNALYIGMQYTNPSFGLSAKFELLDDLALQAIIDFIGDVNLYEGRGIFIFDRTRDFNLYAYGGLGFWVYNYVSSKNSYKSYNYRTSFGFGAGVGVEFALRKFKQTLPPLMLSMELGFRIVNLQHYNVVPIGFGLGLYYRF